MSLREEVGLVRAVNFRMLTTPLDIILCCIQRSSNVGNVSSKYVYFVCSCYCAVFLIAGFVIACRKNILSTQFSMFHEQGAVKPDIVSEKVHHTMLTHYYVLNKQEKLLPQFSSKMVQRLDFHFIKLSINTNKSHSKVQI